MKIVGEATARGSVETVWGALHDAAVLARAIPGCEQFEISGPGLGQFIATTALPAIGGTYAGKLTVAEQQRPSLLKLTVSATGEQGTMTADVTLRLSDTADATTLVSYEANGTVAGSIAGVGTRLLVSAAKRLADEFFAGLNESVTVPEPAAVEPAPRALARPRRQPEARAALIAGAAIGLAGVLIGVLAGRRGRRASGYGRE
jgi:uncharacterized protein